MGLADIARAKQIQKQLDRLQSVQDAEERDRHAYKFATYQGKDPVDGTDIVEVDGVKTSGFKLMSNAPLSIGDRVNLRPNQQGLQRVDAKNVAPVVDDIAEEIVNYIYVSTYGGLIIVINTTTNRITKKINVGSLAYGIIYCPSNKKIYASKAQHSGISVIRPTTNTVIENIAFPATNLNYPMAIAYSPSNNKIYTTNYDDVTSNVYLSVIDPATNTIVDTIDPIDAPVSPYFATGGAYSPATKKLYFANGSESVSVINPFSNSVTKTIDLSDGLGFDNRAWGILAIN